MLCQSVCGCDCACPNALVSCFDVSLPFFFSAVGGPYMCKTVCFSLFFCVRLSSFSPPLTTTFSHTHTAQAANKKMPALRQALGIEEDDSTQSSSQPQATAAETLKKATRHASSQRKVTLCTVDSRYDVILEAAKACGMRVVAHDDDGCNIYWLDVSTIHERFSRLEPWQRINHFPSMSHISRKNRLAQNLGKMRRQFPKEYAFYPKTWTLPQEAKDFRAQFGPEGQAARGTTFILKPENSSKGRGIFLIKSLEAVSLTEHQVAQLYIHRPLLMDGFKFDLRMYTLVTSCQPLRLYKYSDGLVRLCTAEYTRPNAANLENRYMHLTNNAINRCSENYAVGGGRGSGDGAGIVDDDETGSKRSLKWFLKWIGQRYGKAAAERLWQQMGELCVKTVLSIEPTLVRDYKALFGEDGAGGDGNGKASSSSSSGVQGSRAFEILGFDILIDQALKPWLIEVNTLPSFATDSPVDRYVKKDLIEQTLRAVQAQASDQRSFQARRKTQSEERLRRHRQRTDALSNALRDEANVVVQTRRKIEKLLRQHAPDRLGMVGKLMSKNKGREASLLGRLTRHFQSPSRSACPTLHPQSRRSAPASAPASRVEDFAEAEEAQCPSPGSCLSSLSSSSSSSSSSSLFAAQSESEEPEHGMDDAEEGSSEEEREEMELMDLHDEVALLKGFVQIYPVPAGAVDVYSHLVEYVWEREHKLLRGNRGLSQRPGSALTSLQRKRLQSFMPTTSSGPAAGQGGVLRANEQGDDDEHDEHDGMHRRVDDKQDRDDALTVLNLLNRRTSASRQGRAMAASEDDGKLDALLLNLVSDGSSCNGAVGSQRRRLSSSASSCNGSVGSASSVAQQTVAAERLMRGYSSGKYPGIGKGRAAAAPRVPPLSAPRPTRRPPRGLRSGYKAMTPKVLDLASCVSF